MSTPTPTRAEKSRRMLSLRGRSSSSSASKLADEDTAAPATPRKQNSFRATKVQQGISSLQHAAAGVQWAADPKRAATELRGMQQAIGRMQATLGDLLADDENSALRLRIAELERRRKVLGLAFTKDDKEQLKDLTAALARKTGGEVPTHAMVEQMAVTPEFVDGMNAALKVVKPRLQPLLALGGAELNQAQVRAPVLPTRPTRLDLQSSYPAIFSSPYSPSPTSVPPACSSSKSSSQCASWSLRRAPRRRPMQPRAAPATTARAAAATATAAPPGRPRPSASRG